MEVIPTEDLDGDRIRDLIVNLVRIIPATAVEPFIASVSGKTGETIAIASLPIQTIGAQRRLWPTDGILFHMPIGKESREYRNFDSVGRQNVQRSTMTWDHQVSGAGTSNLHKLAVTPPLSVTHDDGEPVAVAITDKSVAAWSLKTGKQVGETVDLTFNIASKPLAVRIGNDQPPAFLVWASVGRNLTDPSERPLALVVLGEKKPRWVISTKLHWDIYASGLERSDLPIASDLDGDGVDELLIAERDSERWAASGTIVCLDAATGEMKWPRRVELESVESMAERAAVLRDFDGDGVRDLAVVTLNGRRSSDQLWGNLAEHANYAVYVDLLSGADGRRLGWWREPFSTPNIVKNVLDIDRLCSDGDTKLEATVVVGQLDELRLEATTVRFDLSSEEPPEISRGLDRLGFRDSRVDLGFYRRRPGVDGFYENRVHWIERHSEAELRMDAEWVLANWNTHRGAGRLLLDDTTHSIVRAVDAKTGRVLWSYRHGGFGSNAVPIVDATGNAEQLLLQSRQGGDVTTVLLDAEKGTPRGTLEQRNGIGRLANAYVCDDTNDRTFWLITNATFSTSGLLASGKQGMRLSKISALTGEIIWQTRFLIGLGPGSGGLPPLVSVLRVDCDNDGVLDAVVPDEGEETSVSLAAISGVDGKRLWNHDVKLQIDRWSSEHPWPLMDACGPEQDRRIVLMDMETPMSVGLRMLSARGGIDIDQRVLQLDRDHSRSGSYLFTGNHRLRLNRVDATSEWPRYAVAYPTRPAASNSNAASLDPVRHVNGRLP